MITKVGPTSASNADLAEKEASNRETPYIARTIPRTERTVYVLTPLGGSGMSLTARMMLSLLTHQEVRRIVRYVMKSPSANAVNMLVGVKVKLSSTWATVPAKRTLII